MWILVVKFSTLLILTLCTSSKAGDDCSDGWFFKCSNGKCIARLWVCDGSNDCGNMDDEKDCDERQAPHPCLSSQFKCESDNHCIPEKWHCDGDPDCTDLSDEKNCENVTTCTGFRCRDGHCIPKKWHCDKQPDCPDGFDEELCDYGKLCSDSEFVCSSGSCLNETLVCNGKKDCSDGSDEGPHCGDPCENSTCSQHCRSTPSGTQCYCDDGFVLDEKDNKTCTDINECVEDGFCSHTCINTVGSYKCICNSGYDLVNRTCRAAGPDPLLIFSIIKEVRGMKLRSKQYFPIRNAESRATSVDVDPYSEKLYWIEVSNKSAVYSSDFDGRGLKTILSHGLLVPEDIAVDYLAHNVYLTDSGLKQVLACRMDGKMCHVLHNTNVERPRSIALDMNNGLMYWSDWGEQSAGIYRSGMDGSNRIPLVSKHIGGSIGWANGIALDPSTNRLYWADAKFYTIEFITLDPSRTRKVIMNSTVFHPYSLTVFEDTIYWSDWYSLSLESCNKFTGHQVTILARENRQHIMGIHVYHPVLAAKEASNPCWSHDCSHMCLRSSGRGYTCACPHGYKLLENRKTCTLESHGADIFVSEGSTIFQIRPESVGSDALTELRLPLGSAVISRVAFDSRSRYLFVADVNKPAIYAVNMNSQKVEELAQNHVVSPADLAFDWTSNNLYWIDASKGTAEVINIFLHRTVTLLTDLQPVALAISPISGHMFIASIGIHSVVKMYGMDGKSLKILSSIQGMPIALALHPTKSLLYWADPRAGTISYANYTSSRPAKILKTRIDTVMSVAVSDEEIYWTAKKRELNILKGNSTFVLQLLGEEDSTVPRRVTYSPGATPGLSVAGLCLIKNGGCSYVCLTSTSGRTCACSSDTILSGDNVTCAAKPCNESDFKCMNGQCVKGENKCDGVSDCDDGSDEIDCGSRCPANDFQCKNGKCILKSWHCDHRNDCGDNSDEKDCPETANCTKEQVRCLDGECVSELWRCDGEPDCMDGSDESNCNATGCSSSQVRCDNGQCVPKSWVCDGTDDCFDKSDERNCTKKTKTCTIHEFRCESDGSCLDELLRCNGFPDCADESDEKNCPQRPDECKPGMFTCKDRACVYDYEVCDGHHDCSQNEDEMNCTHTVCQPEEILCLESKRCISRQWICDGDADCSDGSDEEKCVEATTPLPTLPPVNEDCDAFFCYVTGQCLPWSKVCDGHSDCADLPDEGGLCSRSCGRDNGGCSHVCKKTPHGSKCMCNEGYRLLHDNKTCDDIDECHTPGTCSHICVNTRGSYKCGCADGYYLETDHRSCKAEGGPAVLMYLLGDQIRGLDLHSHTTKVYFDGKKSYMKGMDFDIAEGTFYWAELDDGSINRFSIENRTKEVIFRSADRPLVIKYDWIAKNLYFLDKNSNIGICRRDGNFCKILLSSKEMLFDSLAIAPTDGLMFWTIWANPLRQHYSGLIERAEMDGAHRTTIVSDNTKSPTGIAVDHVMKMIYWSDRTLNTLECADFHGFQKKLIVHSNAYHPFAVAVFEDNVYWADWGSYSIIKCHKYANENCEKISGGKIKTEVLLTVHDVMQPKVANNPCQNSKCKHMCVLTRSDHACMCEDAEGRDDGSCVTSHEMTTLPPNESTVRTLSPGKPSRPDSERVPRTFNPEPSRFSIVNISTTPSPVSSPPFSPKQSQRCPKDYCHEQAECEVKENSFVCKCPPTYSDERCGTKITASQPSHGYSWVIAVLFSIVVTGVIILLIFLCIRHREKLQRVSENVSVKFRNQKSSRDGRLVMDMDDGNPCEELVLGQDSGYKQGLGNSDYSHENSEEGNFKKWPSFNTDSLRIGDSIVNFFQNLKRNSSIM